MEIEHAEFRRGGPAWSKEQGANVRSEGELGEEGRRLSCPFIEEERE